MCCCRHGSLFDLQVMVTRTCGTADNAVPDFLKPEQLSGTWQFNDSVSVRMGDEIMQTEDYTGQFAGIDISKSHVDIDTYPKPHCQCFDNTEAGRALAAQLLLQLKPALIVGEATGGYETPLVAAIAVGGSSVAVLHFAAFKLVDQLEGQLYARVSDKEPGGSFAFVTHSNQARSSAFTSLSESWSAVNCGSLGGYISSSMKLNPFSLARVRSSRTF